MRNVWIALLALAIASPAAAQDASEAGQAAGTALALEKVRSPWVSGGTALLSGAVLGVTNKDRHRTRHDVLARGFAYGSGGGLLAVIFSSWRNDVPSGVDVGSGSYAEGFREGYRTTMSDRKHRSTGIIAAGLLPGYKLGGLLSKDFDSNSVLLYSGQVTFP